MAASTKLKICTSQFSQNFQKNLWRELSSSIWNKSFHIFHAALQYSAKFTWSARFLDSFFTQDKITVLVALSITVIIQPFLVLVKWRSAIFPQCPTNMLKSRERHSASFTEPMRWWGTVCTCGARFIRVESGFSNEPPSIWLVKCNSEFYSKILFQDTSIVTSSSRAKWSTSIGSHI